MKNVVLTALDIRQLLERYQGDMRQLEFQVYKTQEAIKELEAALLAKTTEKPQLMQPVIHAMPPAGGAVVTVDATPTDNSGAAVAGDQPIVKRRGRPAGSLNKPKAEGEVNERKPRKNKEEDGVAVELVDATRLREKKRNRDLSDWDLVVINHLQTKGKVAMSGEFPPLAFDKNERENLGLDEKDVRDRLARSIHKLANKRGDIIKVKMSEGRGFGYILPEWLTSDGLLKKRYTI